MRGADKFEDASDMALVELTRGGENAAYTVLWERHERVLRAAISGFTNQDPDDIAQETFTRIYEQILGGKGPTTAFRAYLIGAARNIATNVATRGAANSEFTGFEETTFEALTPVVPDPGQRILGNAFTLEVFSSLPTRWQEALWYREVEELPVQEVAKYLGSSPNTTTALLKRAREGFTKAWVAANLTPERNLSPECAWVLEQLPGLAQAKPSAANRKLRAHLDSCTRCAILSDEVTHLHKRLALVLFPALLGISGAEGYKAWLQTHDQVSDPGAAQIASVSLPGAAMKLDASETKFLAIVQGSGGFRRKSVVPIALLSVSAVALGLFAALPIDREPLSDETSSTLISREKSLPSADQPDRSASPRDAFTPREALKNKAVQAQVSDPETIPLPADPPVVDPDPPVVDPDPPVVDPDPPVVDPDLPVADPEPPVDDPEPTLKVLTAVPADGIEVGVYPKLMGQGEPGATVYLSVTNENGDSRSAEVMVNSSGRWVFTPSQLRGQLTVIASQAILRDGVLVEQAPTTIGTFPVGDGLRLTITAAGSQAAVVRATNFGPIESTNQVLNLQSPTLGRIVTAHRWTSPGVVEITLPYSRAALNGVVFWQGDTAQGPRRYWNLSGG